MIAGAGEFPVLIARQAYQEGWALPTFALSDQVAAASTGISTVAQELWYSPCDTIRSS